LVKLIYCLIRKKTLSCRSSNFTGF
jgi:hypothetical protein